MDNSVTLMTHLNT